MLGRQINWLLGEGTVEVHAAYKEAKKTLICSVYQMCILTALDTTISHKLKLAELVATCKLNKKQMKLNMMPLMKCKLVKREKADNEAYADDELWSLNVDFKSKNRVLNIVPKKSLKGRDRKGDQDAINSNRKIVIEAATVRIMKSNKR